MDFTNYRFKLYGVILVAMTLFQAEGLIPSRLRKGEMRAALDHPNLLAQEQAEYGTAADGAPSA